MQYNTTAAVLVLALALSPPGARAGEAIAVPGSRVRVTAPAIGPKPFVGVLTDIDPESLALLAPDRYVPMKLPRSAVTKIEVSRSHRSKLKWALLGAGAGVAAGIAFGRCGLDTKNCSLEDQDHDANLGATLMIAGAVAGGLYAAERWHRVPMDGPRVSVAPVRGGGVVASVTMGF